MKKEIKELLDKLSCAETLQKEANTTGWPLTQILNPLTPDELERIQVNLVLRPKWGRLNRGGSD